MDFFRRFSKRAPPKHSDEDEQRLQSLYNIVRDHGDAILLGQTKLSLTTPMLIYLNGAFQKLTEGVNQPCFQVANINDGTKKIQFVSLLFEFMQKVVSLKLISGPHSLDCPLLSIVHFKSLEVLEIRKFPIVYMKNLHNIRRRLKGLVCFRSTSSIDDVISSFGKKTEELYTLPSLTFLDLSYNTIEEIDSESLRLVPSLEMLNLSFNCIKFADSTTLPAVSHLNLGFNSITSIPIVHAKASQTITHLILRNNNLATLWGLEALYNLELLDLACNCIRQIKDLDPFAYLDKLTNVSLLDNPITFNSNYFLCTVRKLSPAKRKSDITLDGRVLSDELLQYLGEDVQPIPLTSYIPDKPIGVPQGSVLDLISSLPNLASSPAQHKGSPVSNGGRIKAPVRDAAILDYACSPLIPSSSYEVDVISRHSSLSSSASVGSQVNSAAGYDSWPVDVPTDDITNELLVSKSESSDSDRDDLADNIYSNQSALSLNALDREINGSPNDDVVVISVVSSDDHKENENTSVTSVSPLLTDTDEEDENECTYLVQNVIRDKKTGTVAENETIFVIFKHPYLLEKGENGKLINKLDLNYLSKLETLSEASNLDIAMALSELTLILQFDLIRSDWKYREYVFEEDKQYDSFIRYISPIYAKSLKRKYVDMKHCECLNCGYKFLMKEQEFMYCKDCGSEMIVAKRADHDTDDNHCVFQDSSSSTICKHEYNLYSSTELNKMLNEHPPDHILGNTKGQCVLPSSWPRKNCSDTTAKRANKWSSLPPSFSSSYKPTLFHNEGSQPSNRTITGEEKNLPLTISKQSRDTDYYRFPSISSDSTQRPDSQATVGSNDNLVTDTFRKCDHRLKLYLTINAYTEEDEDFLCQLPCHCAQYNRVKDEYPALLSISTQSAYIFCVNECEDNEPENLYTLEASCSLSMLEFVSRGYFDQSFSMEFSKPGCFFKFITQNGETTRTFVDLLNEDFKRLKCFETLPTFDTSNNKYCISNIMRQVFCISESMKETGRRIFEQVALFTFPPLLKTQKVRLRTHNQCFVASQLIDWLISHREVYSRPEGVQLCTGLFDIGLIFPVSGKDNHFSDCEALYKFSLEEEDLNASADVTLPDDNSGDDMSTNIKLYSIANIQIREADSTFHRRSLIITETHVFLANECHQWPLPTLQPPPPLLRENFSLKASHSITNVTSLEFFKDAPCYINVCFDDEVTCAETCWLINTESVEELIRISNFIRNIWETLFAIELKVTLQVSVAPLLDNY